MIFSIADKLENVRARIQKATNSAQRPSDSVHLLAVSKTRRAEELISLMAIGHMHFGENYLNEALEKQLALQELCEQQDKNEWFNAVVWHFIGPIQSNKTRAIAEHFSWVHSVDRLKVVQRLNDQRPAGLGPLNCCIQVNIDEEQSKAGVLLSDVEQLAAAIEAAPNLCLRGLMCIPQADQGESALRQSFMRMNQKFAQLKATYASMDTLSMGMSADIELAIECGSTMVRVGTALFGERPKA